MQQYRIIYSDRLTHHGILGQKWGIRRFQNKDGSLTEAGRQHYGLKGGIIRNPQILIDPKPPENFLKKGTKLNSVKGYGSIEDALIRGSTKDYMDQGRPIYTYKNDNDWDNKVYKGPFTKYLILCGAKFAKEHYFETTKDIIMPSKSQRIDEFKSLLNDKKYSEQMVKDLSDMQKRLIEHEVGGPSKVKQWKSLDMNNIKTDSDLDSAYQVFSHLMEAAHKFESTNEYVKRMSSKYDAMIDDNNKDVYNEAQSPIIIFKANEVLKQCKDEKILTMQDVTDNYNAVKEELKKKGKNVLL